MCSRILSPVQNQVGTICQRLQIRDKIGVGYAIALGIAVIGTSIGFAVGHHWELEAERQLSEAQQLERDLRKLQANTLALPFHQQILLNSIGSPEEFRRQQQQIAEKLNTAIATFEQLQELEGDGQRLQADPLTADGRDLKALLARHDTTLSVYREDLEQLIRQLPVYSSTGAERQEARQAFLQFTKSVTARRLYVLVQNVTPLLEEASQQYQVAQDQVVRAERLQAQSILLSAIASVCLAILFALQTSRSIARPLNQLTQTAQRVTQEHNFDLQVEVTSRDEVGILADTLNQLIRQVNVLLRAQQAEQEAKLLESEKMASLGRMLAGVAHEINNPINFVYGNIKCAKDYADDLLDLIHTYQAEIHQLSEAVNQVAFSQATAAIADKEADIDLAFIEADLPKLLNSMQVGAERTRQIVLSLRNFSRLNESEARPVNLHACLDGALLILHNRIKQGIDVQRQYGTVPDIEGYAGSLYQVFTNLIGNAVDALNEADAEPKQITIMTQQLNNHQVTVAIADNGTGIAPQHLDKIFDTYFTTKPADAGTGLGLAISRQLVEQHHGQISCRSQRGVGTTFTLTFPIHQAAEAEAPAAQSSDKSRTADVESDLDSQTTLTPA
jgi:signal transduction histidine kinase